KPFTEDQQARAAASSIYKTFMQKNQAHLIESNTGLQHWKDFFKEQKESQSDKQEKRESAETLGSSRVTTDLTSELGLGFELKTRIPENAPLMQLQNTFIIASTLSGFIVIQQQSAHERVLFERYAAALQSKPIATQTNLFPVSLHLAPADAILLEDL